MYFSDAIATVVRRWPIVLVGLATIVIAGLVAIQVVDTRYQATGEVLVIPPADPIEEGQRVNPYLNLPAGLTFTATLVANGLMSPDAERSLAADGHVSAYSISVYPSAGPLIAISVQDTNPTAAISMRDELIERIAAGLDRIQRDEDVPSNQLMETRTFNVGPNAEVLAGSKIRALGLIAVVGGVLTGLTVFWFDRRRSAGVDQAGSSPSLALALAPREPDMRLSREVSTRSGVRAAALQRPAQFGDGSRTTFPSELVDALDRADSQLAQSRRHDDKSKRHRE